jgi:hypothetical protein
MMTSPFSARRPALFGSTRPRRHRKQSASCFWVAAVFCPCGAKVDRREHPRARERRMKTVRAVCASSIRLLRRYLLTTRIKKPMFKRNQGGDCWTCVYSI